MERKSLGQMIMGNVRDYMTDIGDKEGVQQAEEVLKDMEQKKERMEAYERGKALKTKRRKAKK